MELVEFLRQHLADDEQAAREAIEPRNMHPYGDESLPQVGPEQVPGEVRGYLGGAWGEHFARHDPARVLREVESKRRIIDECARTLEFVDAWYGHALAEQVLCLLALPYTDHPDYREEWKP